MVKYLPGEYDETMAEGVQEGAGEVNTEELPYFAIILDSTKDITKVS